MKKLLSVLLLGALLAACGLCFFPDKLPEPLVPASQRIRQWVREAERRLFPEPEAATGVPDYEVIRAIDGDTLLISLFGNETAVRLIGVDAPESVHPDEEKNTPEGALASLWMKNYIAGKRVTLEYDQELTDRYGRTLAYVYTDGMLVEDALLAAGMARTLTMEPNIRYQHHFEQLEKQARAGGAGFWGTGFFEGQGLMDTALQARK